MPSFDVVSEVDQHELTNAVDQAQREIQNRYDFKGTSANAEMSDGAILITAESDFQVQQMHPLAVKQGIDKDIAKKAIAKIKESKMKVQAQIQGEQLRVTGKKRDDLQQVMALLKDAELGIPMQFQNFRD